MNVTVINSLSKTEFIKTFGNVVESFPKTADELYSQIPFKNVNHIVESVQEFLERLSFQEKEQVLKLHPDLAGKLADEGKLTNESTEEQKAAGLDKLSVENKRQINNLNEQYKLKFGFPFVICARENKAEAILRGLKLRMNNDKQTELTAGINEVKKISKLRIENIVQNNEK